ncbi:MAG: phospholipase A [Desulfuromonadaceae bacterium]|nr:phospholipase A [Desulfuromonadaceae bacterium]
MKKWKHVLISICCGVSGVISTPALGAQLSALEECMLEMIRSGEAEQMELGQLRNYCESQTYVAVEPLAQEPELSTEPKTQPATALLTKKRRKSEKALGCNPFNLIAHRENYILPVSYNSNPNGKPFGVSNSKVDNVEVKFQFSFKFPVWRSVVSDIDLWAAYTNLSFWQAYNESYSSPFRDTSHEPELFLSKSNDLQIFGFTNTENRIGAVHQSNGKDGDQSRSWNRIYLQMVFERDNLILAFKPWYRIPESDKNGAADPTGDDNPDIDAYLGYGEIRALYKWEDHTFTLLLRNNLRTGDNRGAVELGWIFPITTCINGYLQYFNGYGESLIDYDSSVNRIGLGFTVTEML